MRSLMRTFSAIALMLSVSCPLANGAFQQNANHESVNPPPPLSFGSGADAQTAPAASSKSFFLADLPQAASEQVATTSNGRPPIIRQSIKAQTNDPKASAHYPITPQSDQPSSRIVPNYDGPDSSNLRQPYANPNEAQDPASDAQYVSPIPQSTAPSDYDVSNAIPNWNGRREKDTAGNPVDSNAYFDSTAQPAAHFEPVQESTSQNVASQVIQAFNPNRSTSTLPGQPVRLLEVMAITPFESRPTMIRAYWQTFERWALQVASQTEAEQLTELQQPNSNLERDLLEGAISLARSRILESQVDLSAEQQALRRFAATIGPDIMPLPSDLPLVDEYMTNYQTLAAGVPFNSRIHQINEMLPKILQIIQTRAAVAAKCQTTARQAIQAYNQNQLPLTSALEAIRMCREVHQEFVRAVGRYNRDIAEYALTVAPFGQPAEQVVSMLIKPAIDQTPSAATLASVPNLDRSQATATRIDTSANSFARNNALRSQNRNESANVNSSLSSAPLTKPNAQSDAAMSSKLTPLTNAVPKISGSNSSSLSSPPATNEAASSSQTLNTPPIFGSGGGSFSFDKK